MTLKEWEGKSGIVADTFQDTEFKIVIGNIIKYAKDLWHLSDYVVTSAGGSVIWLKPKRKVE